MKQDGILVISQTKGGMYDSFPLLRDVVFEITREGENYWEQEALNRGHGEYVNNVQDAAAFCIAQGAKTIEEVEKILNQVEVEEI